MRSSIEGWIRANLGLALLHLGRKDEALPEYEQALVQIADPDEVERAVLKDLREVTAKSPELPGADEVIEMAEARRRELATT